MDKVSFDFTKTDSKYKYYNNCKKDMIMWLNSWEQKNIKNKNQIINNNIAKGFILIIRKISSYNYSNNGYCTEICKKIVDIGFNILNLDKINADTNINNISSIKVLEKVGFKKTKQINEEFIQYSIIKTNLK